MMPSNDAPALSIVVPLHNEAATLHELVERIVAALADRAGALEIVLVDDGSTDQTPALLREIATRHASVRALTLTRNFGQAAALCCGIFESRGDVVVTMDGDLQNPPEEIPRLLEALGPEVDVVTACRAVRHDTAWRRLGASLVHQIARILIGVDLEDFGGQFKVYRRAVVEAARTAWAPGKPFFALTVWLGFRVAEVRVSHEARRAGGSRYGLLSLVRLNLDLITSFTTVPLALLALLSLLSGTAGAIGIVWCLAADVTSGLAPALSLLLLGLGGVFFATAALGVYLARVYRTLAGGPTGYVVRR